MEDQTSSYPILVLQVSFPSSVENLLVESLKPLVFLHELWEGRKNLLLSDSII